MDLASGHTKALDKLFITPDIGMIFDSFYSSHNFISCLRIVNEFGAHCMIFVSY
jgi:hypothetical protein